MAVVQAVQCRILMASPSVQRGSVARVRRRTTAHVSRVASLIIGTVIVRTRMTYAVTVGSAVIPTILATTNATGSRLAIVLIFSHQPVLGRLVFQRICSFSRRRELCARGSLVSKGVSQISQWEGVRIYIKNLVMSISEYLILHG